MNARPRNEAGRHAEQIYAQVLEAIRPGPLVRRHLHLDQEVLRVGTAAINVPVGRRIWLAGSGKASAGMAAAAADLLGDRLAGGLITTKHGHSLPIEGVEIVESSHPIPDQSSLDAGAWMLEFAGSLRSDDLVIFCLSGGASALLESMRPGYGLDELRDLNQRLLASGAPIAEINRERSARSLIKAGGLSGAFGKVEVHVLVLSDVIGDDLNVIGSCPLLGRPHTIIGNNSLALDVAEAAAKDLGLAVQRLADPIVGDATEAARHLAATDFRGVILGGGEPTVVIRGDGIGGRCQEMAAVVAEELAGQADVAFLAGSTDGTDGPTNVGAALVDGESCQIAAAAGQSVKAALENNNSHDILAACDGLIVTGPTQSNVNDVFMLVRT